MASDICSFSDIISSKSRTSSSQAHGCFMNESFCFFLNYDWVIKIIPNVMEKCVTLFLSDAFILEEMIEIKVN